jgi:hypothetical protein
MKKLLLLVALLQFAYLNSFAAAGDTVVVKAHQDVVIQTDPGVGHTDYPVWVTFPTAGTNYYKVYAYLTFECPDGMDCGEWDYINNFRIGRLGSPSNSPINWEIGRFITPYGKGWGTGSRPNWKHGWYYDMSDYATLLHDDVEIIYQHTGYEATAGRGWKINLSFFCVEGNPPADIVNIDTMWNGSFAYGNPSNPIENKLAARNITLHADAKMANLKIIQTGHGMDQPENCAEFCPKTRTVKFDNNTIDQRLIWKECGYNSLYPQSGTWLYDRTNWCPGESVADQNILIQNLQGGSSHDFDIDMQTYTSSASTGNWVFGTYLVQYKEPRYTNDVSLETVIAPSKEYEYLRWNPICGSPVIVIRNNGKTALTSATIEYGVQGGSKSTYSWTGNLAYGQIDTVTLPNTVNWSGSTVFEAEVKSPNGANDEFTYTNKAVSPFNATPVLPDNRVVVLFKSNKAPSENYYRLKDGAGNTVLERNQFNENSFYRDTVNLTPGMCYTFEFYDDGPAGAYPLNKDGLNWWANTNDGAGYIRLRKMDNTDFKNFEADFGTKHIFQFSALFPVGVNEVAPKEQKVEVYPNPSNGSFTVDYQLTNNGKGSIEVYSITGSKVYSSQLQQQSGTETLDLSNQPKGIYLLKVTSADKAASLKKIVIQ